MVPDFRLPLRVCLAAVFTLFHAFPSRADLAPKWSDAELLAVSDVVLTGTVSATATGWDADTAYTYVTLDVGDVVKGWVPERQVILKQLGGRIGDLALTIGGQATFTAGEHVLVFLEARRRDQTLSTTGLWQGKWTIEADATTGQRLATRRVAGAADRQAFGLAQDVRPLTSWVEQLRAGAGEPSRSPSGTASVVVSPREARSAQPVADVDAAVLMNGVWRDGVAARTAEPVEGSASDCFTRFSGRPGVTWVDGDLCGDMSARGGTIAVSGYWARTATGAQADTAEPFMQILQAGVVVNAGETAARYLANPFCRAEISAHEMAHAHGQTHASMSRAILDRTCAMAALSIQPLNAATRPASAVNGAAIATGTTFTMAWDPPDGGPAPTTYIIEAGSAPGLDNLARFATGETRTSFLATGVAPGTYFVRVYAASDLGSSSPSNEIALTVGGYSGPVPDAPAALASATNGSTVSLTWSPPASGVASSYWIEAGSASGLSDLASFSTGSAATNFVATGVGAGTYFVRVKGMNGGAIGPASNEIRSTVSASSGPCYGAPGAPSGLTRSVSGSTVTLAWNASAGSPSSYVIEAGSAPGLWDLANFDTGGTSTTLRATGVGRGDYFVRVRGRNACGNSAPSNEVLASVH